MGSSETEFDLFERVTILSAFEKANLLPRTQLVQEQGLSSLFNHSGYLCAGSYVSHDCNFSDARNALDSLTEE